MQSTRSRLRLPSTALRICSGRLFKPARTDAGGLVDVPAEFRGNDDLATERLQRLANHILVLPRTINFGRVKESDAALDRAAQESDHLGAVNRLAIAHAAKPEGGDFKALSECALFSCVI